MRNTSRAREDDTALRRLKGESGRSPETVATAIDVHIRIIVRII